MTYSLKALPMFLRNFFFFSCCFQSRLHRKGISGHRRRTRKNVFCLQNFSFSTTTAIQRLSGIFTSSQIKFRFNKTFLSAFKVVKALNKLCNETVQTSDLKQSFSFRMKASRIFFRNYVLPGKKMLPTFPLADSFFLLSDAHK